MADPARQLGYEYTVALVEAIEAQVAATAPRHLAYRGADLSRAVACALFIGLVNDEALYEAYCERSRGGKPAARPGPGIGIAATTRRLLGQRRSPLRSTAESAARASRDARKLRERRSERRAARVAERSPELSACFLLDHSKFVAFVDPVIERLGRDRVLLVPLVDHAEETIAAHPAAHESLRRREQPSSELAGEALIEWPSLLVAYDAIFELLRDRRPGCAVVVEGNSPGDELTNQACRALGIPCLCLQQGWSPIVHNGFRGMDFTRMAVWGEGFREALAPYNPGQRFEALGNPILTTGPAAERKDPVVSFFLQPVSPVIGEDHQRQMQELILEASRSFPEAAILVREHPGWPLEDADRRRLREAPNVKLAPASSHSLSEVIGASRVAVSIYSTSMLEAAALGTTPLAFNPTSMPRYWPDLEELGVGLEVDRIEDAVTAIERLLRDDDYRNSFAPAMASFRQRYFTGVDGRAAERIADLISEL